MKKVIYSLFALLFCSTFAMAQTTLMSDDEYRIMMNDYAVNLNTVLTAECPQGITIDQFKKEIVNGEITLSSTAQASILNYAEPLKTYGTQFATAKNLTATTDAEKIFLSSFAPSTVIDSNGNLVESATVIGLTAFDMWDCVMSTFNIEGCSPSTIVGGNKGSINHLSKTVTTALTNISGVMGVAVTVADYEYCLFMHLSPLGVVSEQNINFDDSMITNFFNQTSYDETNQDVQFITNDTKLLTLKNGFKILVFNVVNSEFNSVYAIYNIEEDEYIFLNVNSSYNNIIILTPERDEIVTYSRLNGNLTARKGKSKFSQCMSAVQDDYESTVVGSLSWNLVPANYIMAAISCKGCVSGYKWMCPYVFQPKAYAPKAVLPKLTKTF